MYRTGESYSLIEFNTQIREYERKDHFWEFNSKFKGILPYIQFYIQLKSKPVNDKKYILKLREFENLRNIKIIMFIWLRMRMILYINVKYNHTSKKL